MLSLHHLRLSIGNTIICRDLTLRLCPGEVWGITGRNGTGKTTLLHTLAGLIKPAKGEVALQNQSLFTYTSRARARFIGLLLQENESLFPWRVKDAVKMGRHPHLTSFLRLTEHDKGIVERALATLELQHLKERFIETLSGGEKRRCHIATLLAQEPSVYLLDEPLNHLDAIHQQRVMEHFTRLAKTKKALVVMVLHDSAMIEKYCSHTLTLESFS